MLELIFQGFFEWIYGLILECWEYFASALLDIMSLDFAYLKSHIPVIGEMMQILLAVGWALLLGNLVFQATKSMLSGLGFEGEDPKLLFARTFVFAFLLLASPQICEIGLNLTSTIMDLLEVPDAVNVQLVDDSAFGSLTAAWLLVIICDVILMFKVLKLLVEIAERYIILAVLTITAPLAFATGGSRNTSDIFKGWCRMYGSMCLLMATHVIFFKMLLSVVSTVPSGIDVLPWMVLVFGIVKAAKKADAIITRIGLNPALTGGGGRSLPGMLTYAVVRGAASSVSKAIGKSMGGKGHGRSSGGYSPTGGGPRSGGPWGGGRWSGGYYGGGRAASAGAAGTAGTPGTAGATGAAGTAGTPPTSGGGTNAQTGGNSATAQQTTSQQTGGARVHTQQKPQGGSPQSGTQPQDTKQPQSGAVSNPGVSQHRQGGPDQQTRKTAVPPGTKLAPSYVTGATGGSGTTQAASGAAGKPTPGGAAGSVAQNGGPRSKAGQPRPGGVSPMGKASTAVAAPGAADKEQTKESASTSRTETRSTHRPAVSPTAGTTRPATTSGTAQPGTAGRASSKDETASVQTETRSTHRTTEVTSKQAPSSTPATVLPGTAGMGTPGGGTASAPSETRSSQRGADLTTKRPASVTPPPAQSGTAGRAASSPGQAAPQTQLRQGRNVTPPAAGVSSEARRSSPAPQEGRRASTQAQPEGKGTASSSRPGTAGTAPKAEQAGKAPRTAMRQPGRAASSPAPTVGKENPARKTSPKPPKRERGPGHGG